MGFRFACAALVLTLASCADPQLPRFEATLAAKDSATVALGEWCAARRIADPPTIRAERLNDPAPIAPEMRRYIDPPTNELIGFRHVRLRCGNAVLSEAYNWYLPDRLTPAMNAELLATDTPFGKVVAPLGFRRERLTAERGRKAGCPAGTVLSHTALLRLPDGQPLAYVVECYTRAKIRR